MPEIAATSFQRFLSFAPCGGALYAGAKRRIYKRNDGELADGAERWELFLDLQTDAFLARFGGVLMDPDWLAEDDIRGLTCLVERSTGSEFLIFGGLNQMIRVDLDGQSTLDLDIDTFLEQQLGRPVRYVQTGEHFVPDLPGLDAQTFIGLEIQYEPAFLMSNPDTPHFPTSGFSTEGFYLERTDLGSEVRYALRSIDREAGEDLARVRTFEQSPFSEESVDAIYAGGYAPWFTPSTNTAWIKKGSFIDLSSVFDGAAVERTQNWRDSGVETIVVTPQDWDTDDPTVIFSHGAGSTPETYVCWPEVFADRRIRTILPYLAADITPQTRTERFSALSAIYRAVQRDQASTKILFAGHSFGAYSTLLAAGADGRLPNIDPGNCEGSVCTPLGAAGYIMVSGQPAQSALDPSPFWFAKSAFADLAPGRIVIYGTEDFSNLDACMAPGSGTPFCRGDSFTVDASQSADLGNREIVVSGFSHGQFACGLNWRTREDALRLLALLDDIAQEIGRLTK